MSAMSDCVSCPDTREHGNADIEDLAGTNRLNAEAAAAAHARVSGGTGSGAGLRSRRWFNDPHDIGMTSLYLERCVLPLSPATRLDAFLGKVPQLRSDA